MKSPFPGMDPYLESRWPGVHVQLIAFMNEAIQIQLPSSLRARPEERLFVEASDDRYEAIVYQPDVAVVETNLPSSPAEGSAVATVDPIAITLDLPEFYDRSIQIIDTSSGHRVVTVIEILSPWNKAPGRLNERYREKLADYQRARVNVVEIDLLRSSRNNMIIAHSAIPESRRTPYMACVWFAHKPLRWFAYPIPLRNPLPTIPIPLRESDPVLGLNLQPLIDRVYVAAGYDDIDYKKPPHPPLAGEDEAWADSLLRQAARR